jgi:MoaA/NifB/PqqE/SkfB family radical SAM enzyme
MKRFNLASIKEWQLEITTKCNASCPQCPRNINGGRVNPHMPIVDLSLDALKKTFTKEILNNTQQIFFCGSYGDPSVHPNFLEILEWFRSMRKDLWLYIHTNGAKRQKGFWSEIAKIMNGYGQIDFGIDGLEDTNHLYRQGIQFNTVMSNAKEFIDAGGRAKWNFLVFKHNEHQIEEAKKVSKEYGFYEILFRKTGRFFDQKNLVPMEKWPVKNSQSNIVRYLEMPDNQFYRNSSLDRVENIKNKYGSMLEYFKQTTITCDALLGNKVVITAEGLVTPCNFFEHNLYDARFHEDQDPGSFDPFGKEKFNKQIIDLYEKYNKKNLNINYNSLEKIFENSFWNDLIESWQKKEFKEGRIFECAFTCGQAFTKCWDQGGSFR